MVYAIRSRNVILGHKSMFKEEPQQPIDGGPSRHPLGKPIPIERSHLVPHSVER